MTRSPTVLLLGLCVAASGCAGGKIHRAHAARPVSSDWHGAATVADRSRLRGWRDAWTSALGQATASGSAARIAAEGALLEPDAALPDPAPPAGAYRCRVLKLGTVLAGGADYIGYPAFHCRIDSAGGALLRFTKLDGSQRPVGLFYPSDRNRMIFLGTMVLGDEIGSIPYGRDPDRDMAGLVERIGPAHWRLVLPAPRWESKLDVIELVPD